MLINMLIMLTRGTLIVEGRDSCREEDKERTKMGIRTGRLLDAERAYELGAAALRKVQLAKPTSA